MVARYSRQWSGEGSEAKAETLRRELEKELSSTPAGDAERPQRAVGLLEIRDGKADLG